MYSKLVFRWKGTAHVTGDMAKGVRADVWGAGVDNRILDRDRGLPMSSFCCSGIPLLGQAREPYRYQFLFLDSVADCMDPDPHGRLLVFFLHQEWSEPLDHHDLKS